MTDRIIYDYPQWEWNEKRGKAYHDKIDNNLECLSPYDYTPIERLDVNFRRQNKLDRAKKFMAEKNIELRTWK